MNTVFWILSPKPYTLGQISAGKWTLNIYSHIILRGVTGEEIWQKEWLPQASYLPFIERKESDSLMTGLPCKKHWEISLRVSLNKLCTVVSPIKIGPPPRFDCICMQRWEVQLQEVEGGSPCCNNLQFWSHSSGWFCCSFLHRLPWNYHKQPASCGTGVFFL